jgi:ATP-binding cassette subfamily A (ABC1) protein 3
MIENILLAGICPQQNVIYGSLTFLEQLELFAVIKGVPSEHVKGAARHMLLSVGLQGAENQLSNKGSGGMKRKLCVGMSLIGGSKVVFLDEVRRAHHYVSCDLYGYIRNGH